MAEKILRAWGTPKGGFVLGDYGEEAAIGAKPGTRQVMMETFVRLDPWKNGWTSSGNAAGRKRP